MTSPQTYALLVPVGMVLYAFLRNRLIAFVQPIRLQCADRGGRLLTEPSIPRPAKELLQIWLNNAYSTNFGWQACIAIPIALVLFVCGRRSKPVLDTIADANLRREAKFVVARLWLAHMLAAPISGVVFVLELVCSTLVVAVLGGSAVFLQRTLEAAPPRMHWSGNHA